jgi:hypothetical protein
MTCLEGMNSHKTIINSFHNYKNVANQPLFNYLNLDADVDLILYSYLFFKNLEEYFNLKKDHIMKNYPNKASDIYYDDFSLEKNPNVNLDLDEFISMFSEKIAREYTEGKSATSKPTSNIDKEK